MCFSFYLTLKVVVYLLTLLFLRAEFYRRLMHYFHRFKLVLKFVDFRTDTSSSCYFGSQSSHLEAVTLADSNFRYIIPIGLLSIRLKSLSV